MPASSPSTRRATYRSSTDRRAETIAATAPAPWSLATPRTKSAARSNAASHAAGAHRGHVLEEPDARLEAERLPRQGAHRTDVGGAAGVRVVQGLPREGADDRVVAALEQRQLVAPAHLVAEADAARALDAAL